MASAEQIRHDEINLSRLMRRLEKSVADSEWVTPKQREDEAQDLAWLRIEEMVQRVKFAKRLLKNIESSKGPTEKTQYVRLSLERMDGALQSLNKGRRRPRITQPSILGAVPTPVVVPEVPTEPSSEAETTPPTDSESSIPSETPDDSLFSSTSDPLLPISAGPDLASNIPSLIPSNTPSGTSKSTAILMQNSNALQEEMTDQLAQMSAQLRRNMIHFSGSLAKDAAVVEETKQKLESNYDAMQSNKTRLATVRGKTWSTTWLTMAVVIAVVSIFASMVFLIRFTRW